MEKDFLNKYKNLVNTNNYVVSFAIVIVCTFVIYCLIHLLNFSVLLYCFDISYPSSILRVLGEFGRASADTPVMYLGILVLLTYPLAHIYSFFVSKYQYVFVICALSEYQHIPLSVVYKIPLLLQNSQHKMMLSKTGFKNI